MVLRKTVIFYVLTFPFAPPRSLNPLWTHSILSQKSFLSSISFSDYSFLLLTNSYVMMTSHKFGVLNIEEKKEAMTAGMLFRSVPVTAAMAQPATTRWNPTPEQLMILEDMYRGGIRTPNAEEIQQITAHLSLYGKIEGKNVFYWFQNHKARDRQKLRRKMETKQQEPKSTKTLATDTALGLDLNHGWIYSSHESRQDQFRSIHCAGSVQDYEYEYEYGDEMESRCASVRPLKTLELFPTCSGL